MIKPFTFALFFALIGTASVHAWPFHAVGVSQSDTVGTSTIYSFDGRGIALTNRVGQWTPDQKIVNAYQGNTIKIGGTYYRYGGDDSCGEYVDISYSRLCGPSIYTTTDFSNKGWTYQGKLLATLPTACGGSPCTYKNMMLYNPNNGTYVFFMELAGTGVYIWVCPSPTGGATPTTPGTLCVLQSGSGSFGTSISSGQDTNEFVDPATGIAYFMDRDGIAPLNSAYTALNGTRTPTNVGLTEAFSMFERNGTYYLFYGPLCPDCNAGVNTVYQSASSPLGPWTGVEKSIGTGNTCNGQSSGNAISVNTPSGTVYLYVADLWYGYSNNAGTVMYYKPLTFTGSAIDPLTCSASKTLNGVVRSPPATKPVGSDQSSWPLGQFGPTGTALAKTQYGGRTNVLQTFVPTNTGTLSSVQLSLSMSGYGWVGGGYPSPMTTPAVPLTVSIVTVDSNHKPVTTLSSVRLNPSDLTWGMVPYKLTGLATHVTRGTEYGIELSANFGSGEGAYLYPWAANNPYPAGVFRWSQDNGATWMTMPSYALLFNTFGP